MVDKVLGAKVRIEINEEGSYEGFVHSIDQKTNKLTLAKVVSCTTGTKLHGLHHFFPKEIVNLCVLETRAKEEVAEASSNDKVKPDDDSKPPDEPSEAKKENEETNQGAASTEKRKSTKYYKPPFKRHGNLSHSALQKAKPMRRDPSDDGASLLRRKPTKRSHYYAEMLMDTPDDSENFIINPPDVVVVDSFGESFDEAVAYISRQRVVGLAWEGIKVGRFGNICLIQVGCNKCVYIFDIVALGDRAFDCGLADILDSADILKVVHNCRHLSDALYHQYGISLVNVFDTQVADVIIYRNELDGDLPRHTSSLISSLYEYLDLSPDEYHFYKTRLKLTTNEFIWKQRPMSKDLIDAVAKTVMYLRELRLAQMERMMEEFIFGVDIYLSCMRDASDGVVKKTYSSTALPEMFKQLHKGRRDRPRYRQLDPELDQTNDGDDPRLAWQDGHNFLEKYEKRGMRVREHKYAHLHGQFADVEDSRESTDALTLAASTLQVAEKSPAVTQQPPLRQNVAVTAPNPSSQSTRNSSRWNPTEGIFSRDDFPQLSSDSDSGSGFSPSNKAGFLTNSRASFNDRFHSHQQTGRLRMGRGRALDLNIDLPQARLPTSNVPAGLNLQRNGAIGASHLTRLQFPTEEELLTVPEVVPASRLAGVPGGTRVRVTRQSPTQASNG